MQLSARFILHKLSFSYVRRHNSSLPLLRVLNRQLPTRVLIASSPLHLRPVHSISNQSKNKTMSAAISTDQIAASGDKSELDTQILDVFQKILNDANPTAQSADDSANEINELFQTHQKKGTDAEDFLWQFWTLLIEVAKKVPATDARQAQLVKVIEKLKAKKADKVEIWGQEANMWDDLALFGPCMREAWNIDVKFDGSEKDNASVQEWISLNSFAARLFGDNLQTWINFGIWELRAGLEEPCPSQANKDMHLETSCEWLTHAGKALHDQGKKGEKLEEFEATALKSGSLLEGQAGATPERWQFWKKRLEELAPEASSADVKHRIQKVLEHMKSVEA